MPVAPTVSTAFRSVFFNIQGARFSTRASWLRRRSDVLKRLNRVLTDADVNRASVYVLAECRKDEVAYLKANLPGYGVVAYETAGIAIFYQKSVWSYTPGRYWTQVYNAGTHGALIVELTHKVTGQTVNAAGAHFVPFAWRQSKRKADLKRLLEFVDGWSDPTFIYMDSNWTRSKYSEFLAVVKQYRFHSLRETAATKIKADYPSTGAFKPGAKPIDMGIASKQMEARSFRTLQGWGSDHHEFTVQGTVTTTTPPRSDTT